MPRWLEAALVYGLAAIMYVAIMVPLLALGSYVVYVISFLVLHLLFG